MSAVTPFSILHTPELVIIHDSVSQALLNAEKDII